MKFQLSALLLALVADEALSFSAPMTKVSFLHKAQQQRMPMPSQLCAQNTNEEQMQADNEISRLKSMAQKLRAEAASMEAERAEQLAVAAESAFRKFDTNKDGEISLEELKAGLEKVLKTELTDTRVKQVMNDFDVSGDGTLSLDEFVGIDKFRNRLEGLAREEREQALTAAKQAQVEQEKAKLAEAQMDVLNDKEPTTTDKLVSVLPYLFPLLDSLQFGRFLLVENSENPFVIALGLLFSLYRLVPFNGLIAYLALNTLSSNPRINRLVRFNMQQAIFLDIALFFPGLLAAIGGLIASGAGASIPPAITELGSDAIFGALLLTVAYGSISSLLGITPDKIPLISKAVEDRMPTMDMFDESGSFIPREMREKKDEDEKKD